MPDEIMQVADIVKKGKAVLFAGAGVSAEAGLPIWPVALEQLANHISERDLLLAQVMRKRIKSQKLLEAAELYYLADTDYDFKISGLELTFGKEPKITDRLRHLVRLKPTAFITTNYNLTIEHTWSNVFGKAIHSLHNREEEFPTAYRKLNGGQPFVFHIHGSIEAPRHIIFSQSSFDGLLKKDEYLQFLRHILMTRSLIFIGLSFDDPALKKFLSFAREKLSLICEQPSFACVERNELDLARTLQEAHVTSIFYEKGKNHEELWNLIDEIYKETIKTTVRVPLEPPETNGIGVGPS